MSRSPRLQALDAEIARLSDACPLESWNGFVGDLAVPSELVPALVSQRPELLVLAKPRALSVEETANLYQLIGGLMETNIALRSHAEQVAQLVENWMAQFAGLKSVADQIKHFANFDRYQQEDEADGT